jgi:FkbM family methyltransferase
MGFLRIGVMSRVARWLPAGVPGKARVSRFLLGSDMHAQNVVVRDRHGLAYEVPKISEPVAFHLLIDGIYEVETQKFVLQTLKPGSVFVDVGANVGCFTMPAAQVVGESGTVLAIEASPKVFPYLERNVEHSSLRNVRLICCLAGDRACDKVPFYEAPDGHFGMGSVAPQFGSVPVNVPMRTLDEIAETQSLKHIDLIKIDVEGSEASVLKGATVLLKECRISCIVLEFCDWAERRLGLEPGAAQGFLQSMGYSIWKLKEFCSGRPPLRSPVRHGYEMLVAKKVG